MTPTKRGLEILRNAAEGAMLERRAWRDSGGRSGYSYPSRMGGATQRAIYRLRKEGYLDGDWRLTDKGRAAIGRTPKDPNDVEPLAHRNPRAP